MAVRLFRPTNARLKAILNSPRCRYPNGGPWFLAEDAPMPIACWQAIGVESDALSREDITGNFAPLIGTVLSWSPLTGWSFNALAGQGLRSKVKYIFGQTILVRFTNASASSTRFLCGARDLGYVTETISFCSRLTGGAEHSWAWGDDGTGGAVINQIAPGYTDGIIVLAGSRTYYNGFPDPLGDMGTPLIPNAKLYVGIGCRQTTLAGGSQNPFSGNIQLAAIWDCPLPENIVAAVSARAALVPEF